ncbi:MAG: fibronectin type III domain-containing protein [candidate division Zixibacteria bacterium]|nr:fibronectin type III domain-containing protein [candidate division Zixibacteria bacterium]
MSERKKHVTKARAGKSVTLDLSFLFLIFLALFLLFGQSILAEEVPTAQEEIAIPKDSVLPVPPTNVIAKDIPNDKGGAITISWERSADDGGGAKNVTGYEILRSTKRDEGYEHIGNAPPGATSFSDNVTKDKVLYFYKIRAISPTGTSESEPSALAFSKRQWFDFSRLSLFILSLIIVFAIFYFIEKAKSEKGLFIRKIAGLEAVDDAVGRATEMGRKIIFIPGIMDMDSMQTIAGVTILGRVAKLAAEYEAKLEVPVSKSLVMVTCREVVKEAYLNAGRPDAYNDDMVYYLTDDQFAYAAALDGLFLRDRPAAVFLQGQFYAEALILAETANSVGAIQIAGTAMPTQLPFFVAACDYTLIGEELFAASAYLSKDPKLLGSLKGQDVGKFIFLLAILIGVVFLTLNSVLGLNLPDLRELFKGI